MAKKLLGTISVDSYRGKVEKTKTGEYVRTDYDLRFKSVRTEKVSDLKAAELLAYSDWTVCDELAAAKSTKYPFHAILAELDDL